MLLMLQSPQTRSTTATVHGTARPRQGQRRRRQQQTQELRSTKAKNQGTKTPKAKGQKAEEERAIAKHTGAQTQTQQGKLQNQHSRPRAPLRLHLLEAALPDLIRPPTADSESRAGTGWTETETANTADPPARAC
mmetsp:Transcript_14236/g.41971  ORF Transcript_14236/g.41971 Transcript_14236/m.41971 type:complete len:135 (-) Transcript_14236:45-449(-)